MKDNYSKDEVKVICWRFCAAILLAIIVWLFTEKSDPDFIERFSFAATLSSIILSVLAIFMSVSGEAKTQSIRDKIEKEVDTIERDTQRITAQIEGLSDRFTKMESKLELTSGHEYINVADNNAFVGQEKPEPAIIEGFSENANHLEMRQGECND